MAVKLTLSVLALCSLPGLAASELRGDRLQDLAKPRLKVLVKPAAAYSHWAFFAPITSELAARGHEVQYLHSDQEVGYMQKLNLPVNKSFQFQQPHSLDEMLELNSAERMGASAVKMSTSVLKLCTDIIGAPLKDPEVMRSIREFSPDLVISDIVVSGGLVIADLLDIPKVIVLPIGPLGSFPGSLIGSPSAPTLTPQFSGWVPQPMGFLSRLQNLGYWGLGQFMQYGLMGPALSKAWHENGMPSPGWLSNNWLASGQAAAAVILQGDFAFLPAVPLSPHAHVVGSLTAKPAQQLPAALLALCDASRQQGVVYISTGVTAVPEPELLKGIFEAVTPLRQTVIWKLSEKDQKLLKALELELPQHVHPVKFVPQNDLLGHPAVQAFVTQGGSNSMYESLYHSISPVVIPLFGEQWMMARQAAMLGAGRDVTVPFPIKASVLAPKLRSALNQVLGSSTYQDKAAGISKLMRARRWTPAEEAASVAESVGWTGGSKHKQMLQHRQPWYVQLQLDTTAFLLLLLGGAVYAMTWVGRRGWNYLSSLLPSSAQSSGTDKKQR